MIFFNPQLMPNEQQLRLYIVSSPKAFSRYEDHRAALEVQLHELIEQAVAEKQDPIALIENYLKISYNEGNTISDIAGFLIDSPQMTHAMHHLQDNWDALDDSLPEDSLFFGSTTREQAVAIYGETDLRSYLESLSNVYEYN